MRQAVIRQRLQFHKMREIIQDASGTPSLSRRRLSQHAQEVHANMQNSAELGIQHNLQVQELMLEEILSHGKPHVSPAHTHACPMAVCMCSRFPVCGQGRTKSGCGWADLVSRVAVGAQKHVNVAKDFPRVDAILQSG